MESGSPFGYMFGDPHWGKRYFGGIGILILLYLLMFLVMFIVILPSAMSLASQYANGSYPTSPNPLLASFAIDGVGTFLVGLVFTFLIGSVMGGYFLRVIGNLATGTTANLPGWFDDFGNTFVHGFVATVIYIIWQIPAYIFSALSFGGYTFTYAADGTPVTTLSTTATIFSILGGIWGILLLLIFPIIIARYSGKYRFMAAFEIGQIFMVFRYNVGKYVLVFLLTIVAGIIAALGVIAVGVGVLFTGMYAAFVIAGLWGFAYRDAIRKVMG